MMVTQLCHENVALHNLNGIKLVYLDSFAISTNLAGEDDGCFCRLHPKMKHRKNIFGVFVTF